MYSNATYESDVYSFGIVCWQLFYCYEPYQELISIDDIKEYVLDGNRLHIDETMPELLKSLIEECWNENPLKRPSFKDICQKMINIVGDVQNHVELDTKLTMEQIEDFINLRMCELEQLLV